VGLCALDNRVQWPAVMNIVSKKREYVYPD
jgi:hypothetical protein